ncbi:hypothetical protein VF21_08265 [Pseudogymnoascus sp. 05NY08]|nr:hypothetical protein VF21_08265 [Pseudogymnoascus sp. 05NY08]
MRFQLLTLLALAGASAANQWAGMENLPDGAYSGINHPDGSTTMTSLSTGEAYTFALTSTPSTPQTRRTSRDGISKRDTSCWGYELDHGGVDQGVAALKNWAGSGHDLVSDDARSYYGFNNKGVYYYYCINAYHTQGNLDMGDIDYANRMMDANCGGYQAGFFRWPGTPELVGKCRSGTAVCLG